MRRQKQRLPHHQMVGNDACKLALFGWPVVSAWSGQRVEPCTGFIESDYDPGSFYPCNTCNPNWQRVSLAGIGTETNA